MIPLSYSKKRLSTLRGELQKAHQQGNTHLYRVILALILIGEKKHSLKEIAQLINVTVKTLFNWLKKFMCYDLELFTMHWFKGRGRSPKLTKTQQIKLRKMIEEGPEKQGFHSGGWNTAMINQLIFLHFQVRYNERYLPRLLKKIGLSYQKAKFISSRLDEKSYHEKREEWLNNTLPAVLKKAKEKEAIVLFGDEVSFAMWGSLGRTWAPVGQQPVVKTTGIRKGLKMYGAIEVTQGDFHYRESLQYKLTQKSFTALKKAGMSANEVKVLKLLMNKKIYRNQHDFLMAIEGCLGKKTAHSYQKMILQLAEMSGRFNGESYVQFL